MAITVKHNKVSTVPDGDDTSVVRPSDWNADHTLTGLGTMAEQNSNNVNITGGSITGVTGLGDVTGPASATDNAIARFNQTTGKLIQNSVTTIDDTGNASGILSQQFSNGSAVALAAGKFWYNGSTGSWNAGMGGGLITQQIGEELYRYGKASAAITDSPLQLVYKTGVVGASGVITFAPAVAGITRGDDILGCATEPIAHNGFGRITTYGIVNNITTNGTAYGETWVDNDDIYYNPTTGGLTKTIPTAPNLKLLVGTVINAGSGGSGSFIVKLGVATYLSALSDVTVSGATSGQQLIYNGTIWTNSNAPTISGGTINGTTIGATTPAAGTFTTITGQTGVLRGTGSNFLTFSQTFQNAAWFKQTNVTATDNAVTAPDGTTTAASIAWGSATNGTGIYQFKTGLSFTGISNTKSIYVRADVAGGTVVLVDAGFGGSTTTLTLSTSWQRVTLTESVQTTTAGLWIQKTASSPSTIYLWGGQVELGSTANTYIPTTTTAVYGTPTLSFSGVSTLGLESNGALFLQPAGTGAIQAQATTSTTAGGNARGIYAVDWQTNRSAAGGVASGFGAIIGGGTSNSASATYGNVLGGTQNSASGSYSLIAGGIGNTITSSNANSFGFVGGGYANTSGGVFNFIGGGYTNSGTSASAVTTQSGTMNATTAVTLSGSNANIKVGQIISGTSISNFPPTYVAAISGTSLTLSQAASGSSTSTLSFFTPHGVVVGGGNNQATGSYSFIGGGGDAGTAANRNVASGDWSVVCGGQRNTASGLGSFVGGGGTLQPFGTFPHTASGIGASIVGGFQNTASSQGAFVGGGYLNTANAQFSAIMGGEAGTTRSIVGNHVFPACAEPVSSVVGASQAALLILGVQTTDATATALRSNTSAAGTGNQVILPNNSAYLFKATVISNVTGGGNTSGWKLEGVIKRGANAASTTIVGSVTTTLLAQDAGASGWVIAATADTTNGGLRITFTGQASTTIRTVCKVETTEVTF